MTAVTLMRGAAPGMAGALLLVTPGVPPLEAKAPGVTHCYRNVCHRVRTVEQTRRLVGQTMIVETSFYDFPGIDRFNTGVFTSNGERFNAGDPARVASADLPDGTELLVRNPINGRVSHVRVNDFGPFRGNRRLDVTRRVAEDLDFKHKGVVRLEVTVIAPPDPEDLRYRRNRPPRPTTGHLGVVFDAEVPELVSRLVAQRSLPDGEGGMAGVIAMASSAELAAASASAGERPAPDAIQAPAELRGTGSDVIVFASGPQAARTAIEPELDRSGADLVALPAMAERVGPQVLAAGPSLQREVELERTASLEVAMVVASAELGTGDIEPIAGPPTPTAVVGDATTIAFAAAEPPAWGEGLARSGARSVGVDFSGLVSTAAAASAGLAGAVAVAGTLPFLPASQSVLLVLFAMMASALLAYAATSVRGSPARGAPLRRVASPAATERRMSAAANSPSARVAAAELPASSPQAATVTVRQVVQIPTALARVPSTSVIGHGMAVVGTVRTNGRLVVAGTICGRVEARELVLSPGGSIEGDVVALKVEIGGTHRGLVVADVVSVLAGGSCTGEVIAGSLSAAYGSTLEASLSRPPR